MSAAIRFENVSKRYRLGEVGTGTLSHDLHRFVARLFGRPDPFALVGTINDREVADGSGGGIRDDVQGDNAGDSDRDETSGKVSDGSRNKRRNDYVWALKDIDFEVPRGEILGIIGRNGAGKSTLLKLLSKITAPTSGRIKTKGRVASLLEVGTGFQPELTGRENIYLNGALLGMRRHEIRSRLGEIIEFSGCAKYIDTPVKRYSSGMTVRLGFAVAAHLDCEILVVDEVLAVGDAEFQNRCIGRMREVSAGGGKTVLFVSHNMGSVRSLCRQGVVLDRGELVTMAPISDAIRDYFDLNAGAETGAHWHATADPTSVFAVEHVSVVGQGQQSYAATEQSNVISPDEPFQITIQYAVGKPLPPMRVGFQILSGEGPVVVEAYDSDAHDCRGPRSPGRYCSTCTIPGHLLSPGWYYLTLNAGIPHVENLFNKAGVVKFRIHESELDRAQRTRRSGVLQPCFQWETKPS
ncbi:ABC transporter ATP-binding protein [Stieleria sp. ICT_E10.1]|uniref:ABC transporter ATP-binding protein n=1 Tax=Stieleria sedimenti TaxID=2976331 RepID=UPI0021802990|nr:ABC transporter ATP-binding protein [Stieleria sedimenti]MCS7470850.1 ABC transporter ATP-binding protein [Stieleria sedimenti]